MSFLIIKKLTGIPLRLAVANDCHFLHCDDVTKAVRKFVKSLKELEADMLLMTGDISDGKDWPKRLHHIKQDSGLNIAFVLGNHDFYGWNWFDAQRTARELVSNNHQITWLDDFDYLFLELDEETALVGSSSPACLTTGQSPLVNHTWKNISDFHTIKDLKKLQHYPDKMIAAQTQLAAFSAGRLSVQLDHVLQDGYKKVIVALHVAPYEWSARWRGRPTEYNMKPYYISRFLGNVIDNAAKKYPEVQFVCMHGHTHGGFRDKHPELDNVIVMAGEAEYKHPKVQFVLDTNKSFCGAKLLK